MRYGPTLPANCTKHHYQKVFDAELREAVETIFQEDYQQALPDGLFHAALVDIDQAIKRVIDGTEDGDAGVSIEHVGGISVYRGHWRGEPCIVTLTWRDNPMDSHESIIRLPNDVTIYHILEA